MKKKKEIQKTPHKKIKARAFVKHTTHLKVYTSSRREPKHVTHSSRILEPVRRTPTTRRSFERCVNYYSSFFFSFRISRDRYGEAARIFFPRNKKARARSILRRKYAHFLRLARRKRMSFVRSTDAFVHRLRFVAFFCRFSRA
jgi:hypothetical protein